jgi:hypothetical protein
VKVHGAKGDHALLRRIKDSVAPERGVRSVEVNPTTGSVVIHYDADLDEDIRAHLGELVPMLDLGPPALTEVDEIASNIEREAEFLAAHSDTAQSLVTAVERLNDAVRQATGNAVDLRVLVPAGLAAYAFFEVGPEIVTPLWVTLAIFSFNSFVALHAPSRAVRVNTHQRVHVKSKRGAVEGTPTDAGRGAGRAG